MQYWTYLKNTLRKSYDWWIYRRAIHSCRRLSKTDAGFTYLLQLELENLHRNTPNNLKRAAKTFHDELIREKLVEICKKM